MFSFYEVLVVGGGHAGAEAAAAAANLGARTLLISMQLNAIGRMSCNPAMGGIAKGQIVREIDALGGFSGIVADESLLQFRILNRSKGPAMWSPRSQNDRELFADHWRRALEKLPNLDLYEDSVIDLWMEKTFLKGVITARGHKIQAQTVILTNGTFLNGRIHIGLDKYSGGRMGEMAAKGLTESLINLGFKTGRMKTGTPPRIDGRSVDYSKMERQDGDLIISGFSFLPTKKIATESQLPCWITYTNLETHRILESGFDESPLFSGAIEGIGPRYCPSIEDKIRRFQDRQRHQLFIEPEGFHTNECYLNGFSSSLPEVLQYKALRSIKGLEAVKILKPGYAIEYDFFPPTQLYANLETKLIEGLFFAGQINGTTGYEEAAGQGIMAGINAVLKLRKQPPFILRREDAYIGVLIDDLVTKGTQEPYRMFTSRADFRTLLRQDNADLRLTKLSYELGLASKLRMQLMNDKADKVESGISHLQENMPSIDELNAYLQQQNSSLADHKISFYKLLSRAEVGIVSMLEYFPDLSAFFTNYTRDILEQIEIQIKYAPYIQKEYALMEKIRGALDLKIPANFDYAKIQNLSTESREKLSQLKPINLRAASQISGITPHDLQILLIYMGR